MANPTFKDARLKIERANQHITELNSLLKSFVDSDFYRLSVEKDADTGDHVLQFAVTKPVPEGFSAIIGDALHNLRTVLDYVAVDIVTAGGGSTGYTSFPFRETREEVENAISGGQMKLAGADIVSLILDVVQPYNKGGNEALWVLHKLDIGDKHLNLTPTITVAALTDLTGSAGGMQFTGCTFGVGEGGKLNVLGMTEEFTFEGQGKPAFAILFGEGQPFGGKAIVPTLHQLSQLVSRTVDHFEQTYLARG